MKNKKNALSLVVGVVLLGVNSLALAAGSDIRISGFLTTIFTKGQNDLDAGYGNGLAEKDVELDTRDNHLGVQFASTINPKMNVTAQMIARGGGGSGNYNLEADWAYVDFQALESVRLRIGKYKIPQFIASDYLDVGYAYPWVRPPQDVYSTNPLISLNGVDMLYKVGVGDSKLFFDFFYGDGTHKTFVPPRTVDLSGGTLPASMKGQEISFDTTETIGGAIKYAAPHYTVRAGYFTTKVTQDTFGLTDVPGAFGGVGFTLDYNNMIAYAEFIRRNTDPDMAGAFPDQDAWYVTLGYRMGKFLPTYTVSQIAQGVDKSPLAIEETSQALGLRYDLLPSADVKAEVLYVNPKDGNHGLFDVPVDNGTIYTVALDVIF
jgi:hypothetical protein